MGQLLLTKGRQRGAAQTEAGEEQEGAFHAGSPLLPSWPQEGGAGAALPRGACVTSAGPRRWCKRSCQRGSGARPGASHLGRATGASQRPHNRRGAWRGAEGTRATALAPRLTAPPSPPRRGDLQVTHAIKPCSLSLSTSSAPSFAAFLQPGPRRREGPFPRGTWKQTLKYVTLLGAPGSSPGISTPEPACSNPRAPPAHGDPFALTQPCSSRPSSHRHSPFASPSLPQGPLSEAAPPGPGSHNVLQQDRCRRETLYPATTSGVDLGQHQQHHMSCKGLNSCSSRDFNSGLSEKT